MGPGSGAAPGSGRGCSAREGRRRADRTGTNPRASLLPCRPEREHSVRPGDSRPARRRRSFDSARRASALVSSAPAHRGHHQAFPVVACLAARTRSRRGGNGVKGRLVDEGEGDVSLARAGGTVRGGQVTGGTSARNVSMSGAGGRSPPTCDTRSRIVACAARRPRRPAAARGSRGPARRTAPRSRAPCARDRGSSRAERATSRPCDTWSSWPALDGIESTDAGGPAILFSLTRAAAVYLRDHEAGVEPGRLGARNGGRPLTGAG